MNNTKVIIIVLILLMAIFFIGLSLNLIEKDNEGVENKSRQDQQQAASDNNWLKAIDGILAPFADSITPKELSFTNCKKTKNGFILNEQSDTCEITVFGFSEMFKKLSLKPSSRRAKLKITYEPEEGDEEDPWKWPEKDQNVDEISFVILGKEELIGQKVATIILECTNCTNQRSVKITFE